MKYRDLNYEFQIEDAEFSVISICLEKLPFLIPMHTHSRNSYEVHYIPFGYGTLITKTGRFDITPGTLFVTGPGIAHEQISVKGNPMTEYCLYMKVETPVKGKTGAEESFLAPFFEEPFWFGRGDNVVHELMKQIVAELEARAEGYELALEALLKQVMVHVVRKYRTEDKKAATVYPGSLNTNDMTYLIIEEAFLYDYRDITLEHLAELVRLSKRQTERLLQMHYNKTFLQKKTEARMSAACTLLVETKMSVSAVAEELGYSSVEHFSTAFKKYMGRSPSAYLRQYGADTERA